MKGLDIERLMRELTLEEKAQLVSGRDFWKTQDVERLGIPAVMMCDGPNGLRKQEGQGDHLGINASIPTVCYPTASALGSSFDRALLKEQGELLAAECLSEHVGMLLGPGVNMKRSPLCGRNFEYYSEDPYLVGELAAAYIEGLQGKGVAACVKHFAANSQETGRMSASMDVDERTLREIYFPAFEAAVKKGRVRSVMCSYNAINGTFSAENGHLLRDILRGEWGFDGFVVTDWGASKNRAKGLAAGVDLEMPGGVDQNKDWIVNAVRDGRIPMEELDAAVRNVLRFVSEAMAAGAAVEDSGSAVVFDRTAAEKKSAEFAAECAVLLKNDGALLPLGRTERVAFVGEFAEKPRYQGAGSSHVNVPHPVSALEAAAAAGIDVTYARGYDLGDAEAAEGAFARTAEAGSGAVREFGAQALIDEAVETAKHADKVVVFAGLPESFEMEGADRRHLRMPENQTALIRAVAAVNSQVVVVLHTGSCVELPWKDAVQAILLMHLGGGGVGTAEVELLYGEKNPSGKLAETWPVQLEDNPSYLNFPGERSHTEYREEIYIGYRYYDKKKMAVNYPFGHGLSYTTFVYSDLRVSRNAVTVDDSARVANSTTSGGSERADSGAFADGGEAVESGAKKDGAAAAESCIRADGGEAVESSAKKDGDAAAESCIRADGAASENSGCNAISEKETVTVTCKVKNTGARAGKEIVQLYISQPCGEVHHPIRELKGFEKIALDAGEEKEVRFELDGRAFSYYETEIHDFYAESGRYVIAVGASSRDIRMSAEVEIRASREIPISVTPFSEFRTLQKTAAGRSMLEALMTRLGMGPDKDGAGDSVLGESMESKREAFYGMPIMALATFGVMGADEVEALVADMNRSLRN